MTSTLPPEVREVFGRFITCELTTVASNKQPITWHYKGYHAWFQVRVAIEQFVIRNGTEIVTKTLQSAGPVNCCASPSGGFDYSGTATFRGREFGRFRLTRA